MELDEFTAAYIECMLWAETDESTPSGGEPLEDNYGVDDFAPETLKRIVADCEQFQRDNAALLEQAYRLYPRNDSTPQAHAGHDFWLTRTGHGAGFWDEPALGDIGDKLTDASKAFRHVDVYVGDDGKLYLA